jgi:indole-3-glycerol phosphate synthase
MILHDILARKKIEVADSKARIPLEEMIDLAARAAKPLDMAAALSGGTLKLIAEVKKASPSRGVIRRDFDPVAIARTYADNRAAAISVVTEEGYFQGSPGFLGQIRNALDWPRPPLLRKDFIFDPYQVYESLVYGADSLILIAAMLTPPELEELVGVAHYLGMEPLVEAHDEAEMDAALVCGARIIGINSRDLKTFDTDLGVIARLCPLVPRDRIVVSESGIKTALDIREMRRLGVNAVLVGEALVSSPDIGLKIRELMG